MFNFFNKKSKRLIFGKIGENPTKPCIGEIDTYNLAEAKLLAKKRRKELLSTVCADDIGRVERALASGDGKLAVYVRYSLWDEFFRNNPGFHGCVDFMYHWSGVYVYYKPDEIRNVLQAMRPSMIRPTNLSDCDYDRILSKSNGMCWICGKHMPDELSVQDMTPYAKPYMVIHDKYLHPEHDIPRNISSHMCKSLCGNCLRLWRHVFESEIKDHESEWEQKYKIPYFFYKVEDERADDILIELFRQACRHSIGLS